MTKNETALITGASSGIGLEMARIFAKQGYHLVLVARDIERLHAISKQIRTDYDINVTIYSKDLTRPETAYEIYQEVQDAGTTVDILVNNAGIGFCGRFSELDEQRVMELVNLNIITLTLLTRYFIQNMISLKSGKILNVASTGSFMAGPFISVYYASKAYVLSLSESIRYEVKNSGITVTALCPGATKTRFDARAGKKDDKNAMDATKVAQAAVFGLLHNKKIVVPGARNKIMYLASRLIPRSILTNIVAKAQQNAINQNVPY